MREILSPKGPCGAVPVLPCSASEGVSSLLFIKPMNPCHTFLYFSLFQKFDAFSQALGRTLLLILRALFERSELVRSPSGVRPIWFGLTGRQWFCLLFPKEK